MKRMLTSTAILAILAGAVGPARAGDSKAMSDAVARTSGALAVFSCRLGRGAQGQTRTALAVCVAKDAKSMGVFLTLGLNHAIAAQGVSELTLTAAGAGGKAVGARLIGIDPVTEFAFVQATEAHAWSVVTFAAKSNLSIGQEVVSVGLLPEDMGHQPYAGVAKISSFVRLPERTAYVLGGQLTTVGSPVFGGGEAAIGLVTGRQMFRGFETQTQRGAQTVPLRGLLETSYFTPVEEFVGALKRIGTLSKHPRPAWMGVLQMQGADGPLAEMANLQSPGVMLSNVVSGGPAALAGLQDRDIVVSVNGKPLEPMATANLLGASLRRQMLELGVGATVKLGLIRGAERIEKAVTLEAMPVMPTEAPRSVSRPLGLIAREVVALDRAMGGPEAAGLKGVIVITLQRDGSAQNAGLQVGDVVTGIDAQAVTDVETFEAAVAKSAADMSRRTASLQIIRNGKAMKLDVVITR